VAGWGTLLQGSGFAGLTWENLVMFAVAGVLIYLAVTRNYEPLLLVPIGFGAILANLPFADLAASSTYAAEGGKLPLLQLIYSAGISTELLPPLIFLGVGALTDFRPLLARPLTLILGAAAQLGIFVAALGAHYLFGFSAREAASIGIIGGADGPTSIFLTAILAPHLLGAVAVAAYTYMALVPVIQPPILRLMTTRAERAIPMAQERAVSRAAVILFPIVITVLVSLAVPPAAPLIGMLMFGNLLKDCARRRSSSSSSAPSPSPSAPRAASCSRSCSTSSCRPSGASTRASGRPASRPCRCRRGWCRSSSPSRPRAASTR